MKSTLCPLLLVLVLATRSAIAGAPSPAPPQISGPPDATLTIAGGVIALGVGYEWARGTLHYQGRTIPFWVHGLSVMDLGAAKIAGAGEVFQLKSLDDFAGNYVGTTFGSALAHGDSLGLLKNEHGVTIRVRSTVSGVRINFSGNGMRIRLMPPDASKHD